MHLWPQKQIQLSPSLIHQKTHTLCITHNKTEVRCTFHAFNTLYTNSNVCFLDPSSPNFSSHLWSVCKSSLVTDDTLVNALVISNISISGNPRRSKLWDLSLPGNRSVPTNKHLRPLLEAAPKLVSSSTHNLVKYLIPSCSAFHQPKMQIHSNSLVGLTRKCRAAAFNRNKIKYFKMNIISNIIQTNIILKRPHDKVIPIWPSLHGFLRPILEEKGIRILKYPFEPTVLLHHLLAGRYRRKTGDPLEEVTWGDRINIFI